jgi:integrase
MPRLHLTDATVRDLPAPPTRTDFTDDVVPGLALRVSTGGQKTWAMVLKVRGVTRRVTLGRYPGLDLAAARKAARSVLLDRAKGLDPTATRQGARHALTFAQLADAYIEQWARPHKRSWRVDARQLRVFCRPRWQHRTAADVSRADVRELLALVAATRSGVIANRLRACLSKTFNWAVSQGLLEQSPVLGLPKPGKETSRERVLSDDEVRQFWAELLAAETRWLAVPPGRPHPADAFSPTHGLWLRLRLLTGQRGGEIVNLRWADVDLARQVWTIPGDRYKNGRPHVTPLSRWVCDLLAARRAERPFDDYVLEGGRGLASRTGIGAAFTLPDFVAHDLRRLAATRMAELGVARFVVARVLGHTDAAVTAVYDRYEALAEKRAALDLWAVYVARVLDVDAYAERGTVLAFPGQGVRR